MDTEQTPGGTRTADETRRQGREILSGLMGTDYVQKKDARRNSFNAAIQDYSEEVCFGRTWSRPGIDHKQRSLINVAMLTALNRPTQLAHHVEGALTNGADVEEIREILLQAAVYCGLPAAGEAFRVAEDVLRAHGRLD